MSKFPLNIEYRVLKKRKRDSTEIQILKQRKGDMAKSVDATNLIGLSLSMETY